MADNTMTDEEKVALLRLLIADTEKSPFYPLFSSEELLQLINLSGGDVRKASITAAISASMMVGSYSSREQIGDLVIVNDYAKNYAAALNHLITNPSFLIPDNLIPWSDTSKANILLTRLNLGCTTPDDSCRGWL